MTSGWACRPTSHSAVAACNAQNKHFEIKVALHKPSHKSACLLISSSANSTGYFISAATSPALLVSLLLLQLLRGDMFYINCFYVCIKCLLSREMRGHLHFWPGEKPPQTTGGSNQDLEQRLRCCEDWKQITSYDLV